MCCEELRLRQTHGKSAKKSRPAANPEGTSHSETKHRALERQLHARRQRHAGRGFAHLLLSGGFGLVRGVVDGRGDQVFEHFLIVFGARKQTRIDFDALGFVLAGHGDLHHAGAGLARHFNVGELGLSAFNVFLHFLSLREQAGKIASHFVFTY